MPKGIYVRTEECRKNVVESNRKRKGTKYGPHSAEAYRSQLEKTGSQKGRVFSEETRRKMSLAAKGKKKKPFTEEHIRNMCKAQKGRIVSPDHRRKLSEANRGKIPSLETREKISKTNRGRVVSDGWRRKISDAQRGRKRPESVRQKFVGERSHFWKGGVTKKNQIIRSSSEYKRWRLSVFERDKFTCVICKTKGSFLNADHIKPFALYPDLRFDINNGRTLCRECHVKTDTFGRRSVSAHHDSPAPIK